MPFTPFGRGPAGDEADRHSLSKQRRGSGSKPLNFGLEMSLKAFKCACAATFAFTMFASSAPAATLVNGDFETGDLTGWTIALTENGANFQDDITSFDTNQDGTDSNAANFRVGRVARGVDGGISFSQTFSVTTAGIYDFGVDVAGAGVAGANSDGGTFALFVAGSALDSFASGFVGSGETKSATLSGSLDLGVGDYVFDIVITRRFFGAASFAQQFVDDAFITGPGVAPVPLPASALLLLGGLGGLGVMRRRKST